MDGSRTHRGPLDDPPPVLKTGEPTGTHPLPLIRIPQRGDPRKGKRVVQAVDQLGGNVRLFSMDVEADIEKYDIAVVGAGVGGLTAAAVLARTGLRVIVLEAEAYPGGCAGTFYYQGYRFDAGATLAAGFYPGGPMDLVAREAGIANWSVAPSDLVMVIHLPDGSMARRFAPASPCPSDERYLDENSPAFWRWQRHRAEAAWDLALQFPDWPPQTFSEAARLAGIGLRWMLRHPDPGIWLDALLPAGVHLRQVGQGLRDLVDAQLLISAQATSEKVYSLYAAAALDLPNRGAAHVIGGMGGVASTLVQQIRHHGGDVRFKAEVTQIASSKNGMWRLDIKRKRSLQARSVICDLPVENIRRLLGKKTRKDRNEIPADGWGAFMLHLGVDERVFPNDMALHHQIIGSRPFGEGNTVFVSISLEWDDSRAPQGKRALTVSSHTRLEPWWRIFESDKDAYEQRKQEYTERMLLQVERILPQIRQGISLLLPGTPVTFQRFTGRARGWVGGYPQTNLFRARAPRLAPGLWVVGDSIFPGQSMPAVALGGVRVAKKVAAEFVEL